MTRRIIWGPERDESKGRRGIQSLHAHHHETVGELPIPLETPVEMRVNDQMKKQSHIDVVGQVEMYRQKSKIASMK